MPSTSYLSNEYQAPIASDFWKRLRSYTDWAAQRRAARTREEARNYDDLSASFFASDRVSDPSVPASSSARTSRLSSAGPTARMRSRTVL